MKLMFFNFLREQTIERLDQYNTGHENTGNDHQESVELTLTNE